MVAFSPDGHTLAAGSADGRIWLWNVTDPAHATQIGQPLTGPPIGVNSSRSARTGTPWPLAAPAAARSGCGTSPTPPTPPRSGSP